MDVKGNVAAESLLSQIRMLHQEIGSTAATENGVGVTSTDVADFGKVIGSALKEVNAAQMTAAAKASAYESGADIPLAEVMVDMQKSSLAFEATLQVRNKVLKAYEDIMNMPV
jgi:flagellar hook-basal body complex protein FliE